MSIINVLGESAVRSLALALAVAIVLRVLRVQHARLAKRAWTAVLILSLAMPALVALHIPSFSFTALWSTPRTLVVSAPPPAVSAANAISLDAANHFSAIAQAPAVQHPIRSEDLAPAVTLSVPVPAELQGAPTPARHIAWWQIGFAAYLTITALLLLRVCLGLALAARLWRRAQPFAISETDLPGRLSGSLSVRLSIDLRSPATVGHGILLPLEAIGWDDAALQRHARARSEAHPRRRLLSAARRYPAPLLLLDQPPRLVASPAALAPERDHLRPRRHRVQWRRPQLRGAAHPLRHRGADARRHGRHGAVRRPARACRTPHRRPATHRRLPPPPRPGHRCCHAVRCCRHSHRGHRSLRPAGHHRSRSAAGPRTATGSRTHHRHDPLRQRS